MGAVLTLGGLSVAGTVVEATTDFSPSAFETVRPFSVSATHSIKMKKTTRRFDTYARFAPSMRNPYKLVLGFFGDVDTGLPRIPEGKELTNVVVTLAGGVTFGTGTGGVAYVHQCSIGGEFNGRPIVGSYQIQFSGPVSPNFHHAFVTAV